MGRISFILIFFNVVHAFAAPATLTYQGRILKSSGIPLEYSNVSFEFRITNPSGSCVIYREQKNGIDMTNSKGVFDTPIGDGTVLFPMDPSFNLQKSFENSGTLNCEGGTSYSPIDTDGRLLRVKFHDGTGWKSISPDNIIRSVPYSTYASRSASAALLGTKAETDFVLKSAIPTCGPGYVLTASAGGILTCINSVTPPGGGGTVTNIATGTGLTGGPIATTGTIAIADGGVGATQLANGAVVFAKLETITGLTAGTYGSSTSVPSITVDIKGRITGISTNPLSALPIASSASGKFLKSDGTAWSGQDILFSDIKNSVGLSAFNVMSCGASQTVAWSSLTDSFTCQNIGSLNASTITAGTIDSARLPSSIVDGAWGASGGNATRASGNVGIGTTSPLAILDISSTTSGFLPPRMTTVQRNAIAAPAVGSVLFNTTSGLLEIYNGTSWIPSGQSIPNGAVMAFSAASCPAGWSAYATAQDKVIIGSGNTYSLGATGGSNTAISTTAGAHSHSGATGSTTLTLAQIPSHNHGVNDPGHTHSQSPETYGDYGSGTYVQTAGSGRWLTTKNYDGAGLLNTAASGTGISIQNNGGGGGHVHSISSDGDHSHSVDVRQPYVALLYCQYAGGSMGATPPELSAVGSVQISSPTTGQALVYNSTSGKWENQSIGGALGFTPVNKAGDTMTGALYLPSNGFIVGNTQLVVSNGNIGIGTATPSEALDVYGNLKVRTGTAFSGALDNGIDTPVSNVVRFSSGATEMRIQNKGGAGSGFMSFWNEGAERIRIIANGNVGVGTTSPLGRVDSNVADGAWAYAVSRSGLLLGGLHGNSGVLNLTSATTAPLTLQGNGGKVGIGTTNPTTALDVNGVIKTVASATDCVAGWNCTGYFWDMSVASIYYSGLTQRSDRRLKQHISPLAESYLDRLDYLKPVTYTWKDPKNGPGLKFGLIAQEVESIWPEIVSTADDEMKTKSVDYTQLISPLLRQAQETRKFNREIQSVIKSLEKSNLEKDKEIADLKQRLEKIEEALRKK